MFLTSLTAKIICCDELSLQSQTLRLFMSGSFVTHLCPRIGEKWQLKSWNDLMLAFRKTLEHSVYFLYFPPCVCPFGNFFFLIFTQDWVSITHTMKSTFPPQRWFLSTAFAILLHSLQWNKCGVFWRGGCYAVMYLPSSGVWPVPKQTYRLPLCLSIRLLQTESGTLCVCLSAASSVLVNLSCLLRERQQRMGAFFPLSHVFKEFPLFGFYRLNSKQFPFPPTNCICKFVFISCCLLCVWCFDATMQKKNKMFTLCTVLA